MQHRKTTFTLISLAFIAYSGHAAANECSKSEIDHFLAAGFTHAQVVALCAGDSRPKASTGQTQVAPAAAITESTTPSAAPAAVVAPAAVQNQTTNYAASPNTFAEDRVYFETVIDGLPVNFTPSQLSFERQECVPYGQVDMTESRDKVCVKTLTTVNLKGLDVLKASKRIILIKEQELIVKGDITRKYIDTYKNDKYKMKAIRGQLPLGPEKINIPVKNGFDPAEVAVKLKKYL